MKKILLALFLVSSALAFSTRVVKSKETVTKEKLSNMAKKIATM